MKPLASEAVCLLGPKTVERMHQTRWWAFARVLDHCLYYGGIEDKREKQIFHFPMGLEMPGVGQEPGNTTATVDLRRVMRELQLECERMALLEATS